MKNDLTYRKQGPFTFFAPETLAGEAAWRAIAQQTQWTGKVLTAQLPAVLAQLRKAGFTVGIAKKMEKEEIDEITSFILDTLPTNPTITAP